MGREMQRKSEGTGVESEEVRVGRVLACLPASLPELTSFFNEGVAAWERTQTHQEQGDMQGLSLWATGVADTEL